MSTRIVIVGFWFVWIALMAAAWRPMFVSRMPSWPEVRTAGAAVGDRVFASRRDENRVLVLEGSTVSSIAVPGPEALVVAPDGERLYVVVPGGVAIVDVATATVVDTVPAEGVTRLALSGDGRRLFTIISGDERATVNGLDLPTRTPLPGLTVERGIVTTAVASPEGVMLYLGHRYYSGIITFVDLDTRQSWQAPTLEDGVAELVLSPDGTHLYAANSTTSTGRVTVLDTSTGTITAESGSDRDPASLALDPGRRIYTANFSDQSVSALDVNTLKEVSRMAVAPWPASLALNPSGSTLYVAHNGGTLVAIDTASEQVTPLPLNPGTTTFAVPVRSSGTDALAARRAAYETMGNWLSRVRMVVLLGLCVALIGGALAGLLSRGRGIGMVGAVALTVGVACWLCARWLAASMPGTDWIYAVHRNVLLLPTPAAAMLSGAITAALAAVTTRGRRRPAL